MWAYVCAVLLLASYVRSDDDSSTPHIKSDLGEITGVTLKSHNGKEVAAFLGVPYAEPPVGDLRFRAPVPMDLLHAPLKADKLPPACIQAVIEKDENHLENFVPPIPKVADSEDCLYLNIYAPKPKPVDAPVLVFIHGGGFMSGSASSEKYDGRELAAEENVIVVTVNYRLSVFGFLAIGGDAAPGNMGLSDIREALSFIQLNIHDFGGDPHKVTVMGEGTGAVAAGALMLAQNCSCLFQQVVLLNGSPTSYFAIASKTDAENVDNVLADNLGCAHGAEGLECIKGKTSEELAKVTTQMVHQMKRFLPVADGHFFAHNPRVLAMQGSFDPTIRVLIGVSHNRASIVNFMFSPLRPKEDSYISVGDFKNLIHLMLKDKAEYSTNAVLFHYTNVTDPDDPESIRENSLHFVNDITITCPTLTFADELLFSGNKVFLFYLDHHVDPSYPSFAGNMNGEDIDFFFGHTDKEGMHYKELEQDHGFTLMDMLGRFVKEEDKNDSHDEDIEEDGKHLPNYSLRKKTYLNLKVGSKTGHFLRAEQCSFFKNSYSKVRKAAALMTANNC